MNKILYHDFDRSTFCEERFISEVLSTFNLLTDGETIVVTSNTQTLPSSNGRPIVIVVGDEGKKLGCDPYPEDNVKVVFRYFNTADNFDQFTIFPIPCGYNCRMGESTMVDFYPETPLSQRPNDLFFAGQVIESRRELVARLTKLSGKYKAVINPTPSFRSGLRIDEYLRLLGETKIALVPDGTSPDTFRYTEAMASGCVVIMPRKPDLWYYRDAPVVWINDWSELTAELIDSILKSDLVSWSQRVRKYYDDNLSGAAVARYMNRCLEKIRDPLYVRNLTKEKHDLVTSLSARLREIETSRAYRLGSAVMRLPGVVKRFLGRQ